MCEKRSLLGPLKFPYSQDQPVLGQEGLTVQGVSTQGSQYQKQLRVFRDWHSPAQH